MHTEYATFLCKVPQIIMFYITVTSFKRSMHFIRTSLRTGDLCGEWHGMKRFSGDVMAWVSFLALSHCVILHFSADIGDASLRVEVSLVRCRRRRFPSFVFWITVYICILVQSLVTVDLLDNFLNFLKLFFGCSEQF
jgi:hypothetical protein